MIDVERNVDERANTPAPGTPILRRVLPRVSRHTGQPANPSAGRLAALARSTRGSVAWSMLIAVAVLALIMTFTASVMTSLSRSVTATNDTMLTQWTDVAVNDAIARLNAGDTLPATLAETAPLCEDVSPRQMCWQFWAEPIPAGAVEPARFNLFTQVWVDQNRDGTHDGEQIRTVRLPLEVVTFQTVGENAPQLRPGFVAYHPTPAGLFGNAVHSFSATTISGPGARFDSQNSATEQPAAGGATLSTSGWITYGTDTSADLTLLFNQHEVGDRTTRCTGEVCEESDVRVLDASFIRPTPESVEWINAVGFGTPTMAPACTQFVGGDWIASQHGGILPAGATCISGSLVIDQPTQVTGNATVFVQGGTDIRADLNAPSGGSPARPAALTIYSTGHTVSFEAPHNTTIAALVYAPLAACGNNPGTTTATNFHGSLVCDTVSLAGPWRHTFDEAALIDFVDPVPEARRTFAPGQMDIIQPREVPEGPVAGSCQPPAPGGATGYWRLNENIGTVAQDSVGLIGNLAWNGGQGTRVPGVCGMATRGTTGGPAVSGTQSVSSPDGLTLEFWARVNPNVASHTLMAGGGVRAEFHQSNRIRVVSQADPNVSVMLPFTIQNVQHWHLYHVAVSDAGEIALFIDGFEKARVTDARFSTGNLAGPIQIAHDQSFTANRNMAVDEAVFYPRALTPSDVGGRWSQWLNPPQFDNSFVITDPGTPFTAPINVANNGTNRDELRIRWSAPEGTFPTTSPLTSFTIQEREGEEWVTIGSTAGSATSFSRANPTHGSVQYRVCAVFNGDARCSGAVTIFTLDVPPAPTVLENGTPTATNVPFRWTRPDSLAAPASYLTAFEHRTRVQGGEWSSAVVDADVLTAARTASPGQAIEIQVRAENPSGWGPWSGTFTTFTLPEAPVVSANGTPTLTDVPVRWTSPPTAQRFQMQFRIDGGSWVLGPETAELTALINAEHGQQIDVQARAWNDSGWSDWSQTFTTFTMPNPPVVMADGETTESQVPVRWTRPRSTDTFQYRFSVDGGLWQQSQDQSELNAVIEVNEADPEGREVRVQARARNTTGWSEWSETFTSWTVSGAPVMALGGDVTPTTVPLAWSTPRGTHSFEGRCRFDGGDWVECFATDVAVTTTTITAEPGTLVEAQVRALNSGGHSDWSNVVRTQTITDAPVLSLDGDVTVTDVPVQWTSPRGATGYELRFRTEGGNWNESEHAGTNATVTADHGLNVDVQVRAATEGGWSPWSNTISVITLPLPPVISSGGAPAPDYVPVIWTTPRSATGFEMRHLIGTGAWSESMPMTVTSTEVGAPANTAVEVQVRASNASGWSEWSTVYRHGTTPAQPVVTVTEQGDPVQSLLFEWDNGGGGTISQWEVFTDGDDDWTTSDERPEFSFTHPASPGRSTAFAARVQGEWGWSPWSEVVQWGHDTELPHITENGTQSHDGLPVRWTTTNGATGYVIRWRYDALNFPPQEDIAWNEERFDSPDATTFTLPVPMGVAVEAQAAALYDWGQGEWGPAFFHNGAFADTDGDGLTDGDEIAKGLDPLVDQRLVLEYVTTGSVQTLTVTNGVVSNGPLVARSRTITLPPMHNADIWVDFGDGSDWRRFTGTSTRANPWQHTYATDGTFQVTIHGSIPQFAAANSDENSLTEEQFAGLTRVLAWNQTGTTVATRAFHNAVGLTDMVAPPETVTGMIRMMQNTDSFNRDVSGWVRSNVTAIAGMFFDASRFTGSGVPTWQTNNIVSFDLLFANAPAFNQNLNTSGNTWNVSRAANFHRMFDGARAFNGTLTGWNTSAVTRTGGMFRDTAFNRPVSHFDMANVTLANAMFQRAASFNQPIGNWNMGRTTTLNAMFMGATAFNQPLNTWNTASVTNLANTFAGAVNFNQPLSNWNTAAVTTLQGTFDGATRFNQNIQRNGNAWNTHRVTNFQATFRNATAFNQDIGLWDSADRMWNTGAGQNFANMFQGATAFSHDLSCWNTAAHTGSGSFAAGATNFPARRWPGSNTWGVNPMCGQWQNVGQRGFTIGTGWSNYGREYSPIRARRVSRALVQLDGLGRSNNQNADRRVMANLPAWLRPSIRVINSAGLEQPGTQATGISWAGRIDVRPNGNIEVNPNNSTTSPEWASIAGITFVPQAHNMTNLTPLSGWTQTQWTEYGSAASFAVDFRNRIHITALMSNAGGQAPADILRMPNPFTLPSGFGSPGIPAIDVDTTGMLIVRETPGFGASGWSIRVQESHPANRWQSINITFPGSRTGMVTFTGTVAGCTGSGRGGVHFPDGMVISQGSWIACTSDLPQGNVVGGTIPAALRPVHRGIHLGMENTAPFSNWRRIDTLANGSIQLRAVSAGTAGSTARRGVEFFFFNWSTN